MGSKICIYCNETKVLSEFPLHRQKKDGHDTRCKICIKSRNKEVEKIRKTAPPIPDVCECCGKKPNIGDNLNPSKRKSNLVLDHDPVKKSFRGWLCNDCNRSIGSFGDNLEGMLKPVNYLLKNEPDGEVKEQLVSILEKLLNDSKSTPEIMSELTNILK